MKTLLLTILLLSFGQQAQAVQTFSTGGILLEECEAHINKTNVAKGNTCVGYVAGIADLHATFAYWKDIDKNWCLPDDMHSDQLVRIVVKYLQEHPENLHMAASNEVANALIEAFPCGGES